MLPFVSTKEPRVEHSNILKICSTCKQSKSLDSFGNDKSRPDGKYHCCKPCLTEQRKQFWLNATDEQLSSRHFQKYRYARSLRAKIKAKERREKNGYSLSEQYGCSKNRAKRVGLTWTISKDVYAVLRSKPCEYCGGPLPKSSTGLDRKDNSLGYTPENVVPCCSICNYARRTHFSFYEMKTFIGPAVREIRQERLKAALS